MAINVWKFAPILLAAAIIAASIPALACTCDEICHPGEVYSDEAEMCVPKEQVTS